jgi:hypothetical protein
MHTWSMALPAATCTASYCRCGNMWLLLLLPVGIGMHCIACKDHVLQTYDWHEDNSFLNYIKKNSAQRTVPVCKYMWAAEPCTKIETVAFVWLRLVVMYVRQLPHQILLAIIKMWTYVHVSHSMQNKAIIILVAFAPEIIATMKKGANYCESISSMSSNIIISK